MQRLLSAPRSGQRSKSSALRWLANRRSGSKNHRECEREEEQAARLRRRDDALVGVAALEDRVAVHVRRHYAAKRLRWDLMRMAYPTADAAEAAPYSAKARCARLLFSTKRCWRFRRTA